MSAGVFTSRCEGSPRFDVLGGDTPVYNKPGYVPGDESVDVALAGADAGERYLLAVETRRPAQLGTGADPELLAGLVAVVEEVAGHTSHPDDRAPRVIGVAP